MHATVHVTVHVQGLRLGGRGVSTRRGVGRVLASVAAELPNAGGRRCPWPPRWTSRHARREEQHIAIATLFTPHEPSRAHAYLAQDPEESMDIS